LTAKTAMANRLEGLREGADDYLTKPFNTEELLIRMANLIEIRRRLQVKFEQPNALKQVLKKTAKEEIDNAVEQADQISAIDANFLNKLTDIIHDNLGNEIFSVEILAEGVSMSRSQLFRKVKAITNQTPNEFIRNYRLDQAMEMLQEGDKKINQVAAAVGFKDEKYFSKRFKMRFELLPSEVF
jgi:AraC-like DNA-binding protein